MLEINFIKWDTYTPKLKKWTKSWCMQHLYDLLNLILFFRYTLLFLTLNSTLVEFHIIYSFNFLSSIFMQLTTKTADTECELIELRLLPTASPDNLKAKMFSKYTQFPKITVDRFSFFVKEDKIFYIVWSLVFLICSSVRLSSYIMEPTYSYGKQKYCSKSTPYTNIYP